MSEFVMLRHTEHPLQFCIIILFESGMAHGLTARVAQQRSYRDYVIIVVTPRCDAAIVLLG